MTSINTALQALTLGEAQCFANLHLTPLLAAAPGVAEYLTLAEAQAEGLARVTEVSEAGSVPTLLLENQAEQAVFLLDGEELVGAKQNRILNLSLLAPAHTTLEIPVSCVEQGRWSRRSRELASTERTFFSRGRARKAERVSESLRERNVRESDQVQVWNDISEKMVNMAVSSRTQAVADAYDQFAGSVEDYVAGFHISALQVGACFAINGAIRGLEVFDSSATCRKLLPRLIRSYALDAIEERTQHATATAPDVSAFIADIGTAAIDRFQALGEGEDLRLRSDRVSGGALAARERIVHLCAFAHA